MAAAQTAASDWTSRRTAPIARTLVPAIDFQHAAIQTALAINPVLDLYLGPLIQDHSFRARQYRTRHQRPARPGYVLGLVRWARRAATSPMPSPWLDRLSVWRGYCSSARVSWPFPAGSWPADTRYAV